ncbi:hypothetical protein HAX54_044503, partial [Datura stramonium]|nr:hypothetical protein [Datura stramonium]
METTIKLKNGKNKLSKWSAKVIGDIYAQAKIWEAKMRLWEDMDLTENKRSTRKNR